MDQAQTKPLRIQNVVILITLIIQYVLGMYVNFFVQFPDNSSTGQLWEFSWQQPLLASHMVLGILLFIGALVFLIRAVRSQNPVWRKPAIIGFIGIVLAGFGGSTFIPTQTDAYSYLMSLAFLIAFFSYTWSLYADREVRTT